jgi:hypothetical protein
MYFCRNFDVPIIQNFYFDDKIGISSLFSISVQDFNTNVEISKHFSPMGCGGTVDVAQSI